ncbi:PEP-CTERM sorting domain-containing protein [Pontiella sulfatireligans]|uniref:PEP-CTERM protein-sorting domain-containing protein n=1 Tax=Pontiella sulfatireligans TaxID=2750658 RepID=A0A6C2UIB5_9BACT|nr:PEP-CTERM sorting domain-containing protein [Pontiella sulfatireligans]VGO19613.1 hypothetical protein SCARR_01672 [Pontiella sulfatireligans]
MKKTVMIMAIALVGSFAHAATIENWQMNDDPGTDLKDLNNSAGTAKWYVARTNLQTDGSGNLHITQGANLFNGANLSTTDVTSGIYELAVTYSAADMTDGDIAGGSVGFSFRHDSAVVAERHDLAIIKLVKRNGELRLEALGSGPAVTLYDFNATVLPDTLAVRAVLNLDTDLVDVYYSIGGAAEVSTLGIAASDGELDQVRTAFQVVSPDFGATSYVDVDQVTLSVIPEPATLGLIALSGVGLLVARRFHM